MNGFSLFLDSLSLIGQAVMHSFFVSRLTGKRLTKGPFLAYCLLLVVVQLICVRFSVNDQIAIGVCVLALYAVSRFGLGNPRSVSWFSSILSFYVCQLSFGIINSIEAAVFPHLIGNNLLYPLLLTAQVLFFALCIGCYRAVLRLLSWTENKPMPYLGLLLFPSLFFFAAELYILHTAYRFFAPVVSLEEVGKQGTLLFLQVMGLAALFCTLYAYGQLCQGFQAQAALQSLTQAAHAQKVYITEAQLRYDQTKSFRHDIKNHLSVLDGLLKGEKLDEGRAYLKKLEAVSESLSFPFQTGHPVVDILLGEKLGLAREITAEVSLILPKPCGIDDFDLCVLFANALDNAISACRSNHGEKFIRISGKQQGDFYMLTFENTCPDGPLPSAGTGLSNIKAVAEKYHGAVLTEKNGRHFSLSVLLNISSRQSIS